MRVFHSDAVALVYLCSNFYKQNQLLENVEPFEKGSLG